jgi:hypothetical protein
MNSQRVSGLGLSSPSTEMMPGTVGWCDFMSVENKLLEELDNSDSRQDFDGHLVNDVCMLADAYIERGMLSGAEVVLRHLLDNQERVLGITHIAVNSSVDKLGTLLRASGRYVEADVMEIRHKFLQRKAYDVRSNKL